MWHRFREDARRAVYHAQEEARRLGQWEVSPDHLLFGALYGNTTAVQILNKMGVDVSQIRKDLARHLTQGDGRTDKDMLLTPSAKRCIDRIYAEYMLLRSGEIGAEHLLLSLIQEKEGMAGRILANLGVDLAKTREEVRFYRQVDTEAEKAPDTEEQTVRKTLEAYLIEEGYVEKETIEAARKIQEATDDDLVKILIIMGVDPIHVYIGWALELGQPFVDLENYQPHRNALEMIPEEIAIRLNVLPVKKDDNILYVAMSDTANIAAADELRLVSLCTVRGVLAVPEHITEAISRYYGNIKHQNRVPTGSTTGLNGWVKAIKEKLRR